MTEYSPEPRDAASSDSEMIASRPSFDTRSIHLCASTLNICSAAYCARSRRCPSSAASFCTAGRGATSANVTATAETRAIRMNQILDRNMRGPLSLLGRFFVVGRGNLHGQILFRPGGDLLFTGPFPARPDLQVGFPFRNAADRKAPFFVDRRVVGGIDHDNRDHEVRVFGVADDEAPHGIELLPARGARRKLFGRKHRWRLRRRQLKPNLARVLELDDRSRADDHQ